MGLHIGFFPRHFSSKSSGPSFRSETDAQRFAKENGRVCRASLSQSGWKVRKGYSLAGSFTDAPCQLRFAHGYFYCLSRLNYAQLLQALSAQSTRIITRRLTEKESRDLVQINLFEERGPSSVRILRANRRESREKRGRLHDGQV